jgi:hypothetical protein
MVEATGGVWRSICSTDWDPIFAAVAAAVGVAVPLPCSYELPAPPDGEALDPDRVNFLFTPGGGAAVVVPRVASAADCGVGQGWYYDDPAAPARITVCPATCDAIGGDPAGAVEIQFGCATIVE